MTAIRASVLTPESPTSVVWIEDAYVQVDDDGTFATVAPWTGQRVDEDMRPAVLMPGFVDGHIHFPQARIIGSASGPLLQWLETTTFPEEGKFSQPGYAKTVAESFCEKLLSAGTTLAMIYGSSHLSATHQLFRALDTSGLRAIAGPVLMDRGAPDNLLVPVEKAMDQLEELVSTWHLKNNRLHVAVVPRFALSCSQEMMASAGMLAHKHNLWVTTHLSENPEECQVAQELFKTPDYLSVYEDTGLVHDKSVFAHCIHLSDSEMDRLADAGAVIAHCPDSNYFLGSGNMPVSALMERGISIAMGSDIAGGRSYRIPHGLSRAFDNGLQTHSRLSLEQLFWWGTRGGALALGQTQTGTLKPGLRADMICVQRPSWATTPHQILSHIIFQADTPPVRATWVDGTKVWSGV